MGKNQTSVVVLWIRVKFWWMIPMGVKYNHTKGITSTAFERSLRIFATALEMSTLGQWIHTKP